VENRNLESKIDYYLESRSNIRFIQSINDYMHVPSQMTPLNIE